MKHSIKRRIAVIFMILVGSIIFLCWFINNIFLTTFYTLNKQKALMRAYAMINTGISNGQVLDEDFQLEFEKVCTKGNVEILVADSGFNTLISSLNDEEILKRKLANYIFNGSSGKADITTIKENSKYRMQMSKDNQFNMEFLEVWGYLDSGDLFIMRTAIESIEESVELSNKFLGYIGFGAVLISFSLILGLSRQITKPIEELVVISNRMKDLDFGAKYQSHGEDEFDLLGENINALSTKLETTISELKTANHELQKDIEKKTAIDEMRKEFLSNVSHELKTPIALIQGYAEGLKECINDDEESRNFYCEVIMDEADKMNKMVKKLLTLNQIEFGTEVQQMERFSIISLIQNVIQSTSILAKQNEIQVIFCPEEEIFVWSEEYQIEEVITNYMSNAIHYATGDKIIEVKAERTENGMVRVSVFNTGEPIPEEEINNIWVKFYKVDKARTREYGGSGIGLSIVKAIIESLNGKYGVQNYDNGVEFWFELECENSKNPKQEDMVAHFDKK